MTSEGRSSAQAGGALWPPPRQAWLAFAGVAVIYIAHLAYAAIVGDAALTMSLGAAVLAGAALAVPGLRADLLRLKGLELAGLLFAAVLAAGVWSLTPYAPGGPHPVWTYVDAQGATTVDRSATAVELAKLLGLACFFIVGAATGARDDRGRFAAQLAVVGGAAFGLWAIFAAATGAIYQTQGHRLEAMFLNPNTAGNVFAALFVLAVALLAREFRAGSRRGAAAYVLGLSTVVLGVALLNTASRGAASAALLALIAFFLLQLANGSVKFTRGLGGGLLALGLLTLLVVLAGDAVVSRFFRAEADAPIRYAIWEAHWEAFLRSPLLGYGLGAFEPINKSLLNASNFQTLFNLRAPLQLYLQWLEEGGLLAAVPMFLCVAWLMWLTLNGFLRRSRMTALLAGFLALDLTFIVHGFTDSALQAPSVAAFWAWALGMQVALAQGSSRR